MSQQPSLPDVSPNVVRPMVVPPADFGVSVFESKHAPGFRGELQDDFSKFLLVLSGEAIWESSGGAIRIEPDSFLHIPAGLAHRQSDIEGKAVTLYAIHYRPEILVHGIDMRLREEGMAHWRPTNAAESLTRFLKSAFQEMLYEQHLKREGWESLLLARLLEIGARSVRLLCRHHQSRGAKEGAPTNWSAAERVAQYIQLRKSRFYQQETLDEAARSVGLSRRQFTGLFREICGESWLEHRLRLRIEHASRLLRETDNSVIAIAFEAGFEDLSNFHRAFKTAHGCSPKSFREQGAVFFKSAG